MRSKSIKISIISLIMVLFAAFTMAFVTSGKVAKADSIFEFENGAYVKTIDNSDEEDGTNGGMRFRLKIDSDKVNDFKGESPSKTIYFYVGATSNMVDAADQAACETLVTNKKAWKIAADKDKIYAGKYYDAKEGKYVADGYYYANVLLDINTMGVAKDAYWTTEFTAVATVYDGSSYSDLIKSPSRSLQYAASAGALRGALYDEVTDVYSWLGSAAKYAMFASDSDDYDALEEKLDKLDSTAIPYFYLNDVADASGLLTTYTGKGDITKYTVTVTANKDAFGAVDNTSVANVPYGTTITTITNTVTVNGTTVTATAATADKVGTYSFSSWTNGTATVNGALTITANFSRALSDVIDFTDDDMPTDMFVSYANQTITLDTENDYVRIVTNGAAWDGNGGVVIDYGRTLAAGTKIAITYKVTAATNGNRFVMVKNNGNLVWDYSTVKVNDYSEFVTYAFQTTYATDSIKLIVPDVAATYDIRKVEILSSLADETVTMLDFTDSANNKATTATYLAQGGTLVSDATFGTVMSFKFGRNNEATVSINKQNGFVFATPIVLAEGDKLSIVYNSTMTGSDGLDILMNGGRPTGIYSGYAANTWKTFTYTAPAGGKTINSLGFAHWKDNDTYVMKIAGIWVNNANAKAIDWTETDNGDSITYSVDFSEWTYLNSCSNITYNDKAATIISADVGGNTQNVLCTGINTSVMKTYFDFSDLNLSGKKVTFKMNMKLPVATNEGKNCDMYVGSSWAAGNYNGQWMTTSWKTISETFTVTNGNVWSLYRQGGSNYAWDQEMYIASIEIIVTK